MNSHPISPTVPNSPDAQFGLGAQPGESAPLACDLTAIDDAHRPRHTNHVTYLFGEGLLERQDLPDGYAFRYAAGDYRTVVDFVESERLCCPFFNFTIEVTSENGPLWLRITGRPGAKELLQPSLEQVLLQGPKAEGE